ncbi:hypothetical protein J2Z32_000919 [Paenibacillus turicensis]|uniref:DUF4367 domain-containing protein n=1 Tax=Paenibacillus turicensis TaxID=160487 RepID=A0ABS4FNZ3_9BACL|nr:DUF4367 domain-containing protein [Paenibacillus turicensis]MBP1904302.1 hypothetical protein [Paenibacillus turicensis]
MSDKERYVQFLQDLEAMEQGKPLSSLNRNLENTLETQQLLELATALHNKDFSTTSDCNKVLLKVQKMTNNQEENGMKNKNRFKTPAIVLSAALFMGLLSITIAAPSFAQNIVDKVLASFNLGHIQVSQMETPTSLPSLSQVEQENDKIKMMKAGEKDTDDDTLSLNNFSDLAKYTDFDVLLPTYLPEGYTFEQAKLYKDAEGQISGKYVSLYFANKVTKGTIYMQQRFPDEETAYETSTDGKLEQLTINGVTAILMDEHKLNWETKTALYSLSSKDITKADLIRLAESIR